MLELKEEAKDDLTNSYPILTMTTCLKVRPSQIIPSVVATELLQKTWIVP